MARLKALIEAGAYSAARARLAPIVAQHPGWARATLLLAITYHREERHHLARPLFERALAADPEQLAVRPPYGWCLFALGELDAAAEMFESLLSELPDHAESHYALGLIALERDQIGAARGHLETATALAGRHRDPELEGRARARLEELAGRLRPEVGAKHAGVTHPDPPSRDRLTPQPVAPQPAAPQPAAPQPPAMLHFTAVPNAAGVDLMMTSGAHPSREILEVNGGGIALLDFDRDGDLDIFLANGATPAEPEAGPGSRLYANRGDGTFEDVTTRVGIDLRRWAMGVAVGDVDGDGWDDLYVTCFGPNVLLRNTGSEDGGRRFVDVTSEAGVGDPRWSTSAVFADLDGDGDLDLFVANYLAFDAREPPPRSRFKGVEVMAGPRGLVASPNTLYENLGNGSFRDVSEASGVSVRNGLDYSLGVRAFDFDDDGRIDLFVGNDSTENHLLRNLGGLRFENVASMAGVAANGLGVTQATMGIALADVDGNGHADLLTTNFSDDVNTLQLNLGDGVFEDRTVAWGLAAISRPYLGWGAGFYDFDLDGDEDLFIANGHVYPEMDSPDFGASWAQVPLLFERRGTRFERVTDAGSWSEQPIHGRAVAFGDIDGDGDVDVLVTTLNGPLRVLRNDTPLGRGLVVRLDGPPPNRHGYGSRVEVVGAGRVQRRWIGGGGSFQSADEPAAFFGFGAVAKDTRVLLRVHWPDGTTSTHPEVAIGQQITVLKGSGLDSP